MDMNIPDIKGNEKIAYMGIPGSYTEEATHKYFGDNSMIGKAGFEEVIESLLLKEAKYAVLPIENSSTGSINPVVDMIREKDIYIIGEIVQRIQHCLLAPLGANLKDVRKVISHPQGLQQSKKFLLKNGWQTRTATNTAVAAKTVAKSNDTSIAAIASKRAAGIYGLEILAESINDNENNFTRFVVLSAGKIKVLNANKISLVFMLKNRPGSLFSAIEGFAKNSINLIKLESRPIWTEAWHYFFHLDLEGDPEDPKVNEAISHLKQNCISFRILGKYRKYKNFV